MIKENLKDKKNILIVTTVPETLATILVGQPKFLSNFFNVYLATSPGIQIDQIQNHENINVSIIPMTRGISPFKDLASIYKMVKIIKKLKPDLVHSYTPKAGLITMISAYICKVRIRIHTFTGLIFPTSRGIRKLILICADKLICELATCIIPEGNGIKNDLIKYAITKKSLHIIGNGNIAGVDTTHFSRINNQIETNAFALRSRLGIKKDDFVFCFVGRLNKDKGINELIHAFEHQARPSHLLLIGRIDETLPVNPDIMAIIKKNKFIHNLGFLDDIRPSLLISNVLVLPSYREGFPNVILQAGAMELPVIATDINGSNEIIKPDFNGWLIPSKNLSALSEMMDLVQTLNPLKLRQMGKYARQYILNNFERNKYQELLVEFYRKMIFVNFSK